MPSYQKTKYQLNIIISNENTSILEFYTNFKCHHNGDSGIDLYNEAIEIDSFLVGTINFNIKCEMIDIETNEYQSYYLVPRSSLAKTSFQLANSIGIIDAGYRGNLMAKIRNFNPNNKEILPTGSYFQIISPDLKPIKINIVDNLSITTRNENGFGSTNNIIISQPDIYYTLFFDGCCKGNNSLKGSKGGAGAIIYLDTTIIWSNSIYLDNTTNNRAEYNGLILGLTEAKKRNIKKLIVKGDSKLIIEQVSNKYKIKSPSLIPLYNETIDIIKYFDDIKFIHINRIENTQADELANNGYYKK